jgi:hypothetical protein
MPEYRKTFRTYYKFPDHGRQMLVIENKRFGSSIRFVGEYPYVDGVLKDPEYKPCTEQEFNEAKSIAVGRISLEKIEE